MNVYLTKNYKKTESLRNAHFVYIEDVQSFIDDCDKQEIISDGVNDKGTYYWLNPAYEWYKVEDKDKELFEKIATAGYLATPNIYLSADFTVLTTAYEDNVEAGTIQYKIVNIGEEDERGFFRKNDSNKWKRKISPEEILKLCEINEKTKTEIYREIIKDKYD